MKQRRGIAVLLMLSMILSVLPLQNVYAENEDQGAYEEEAAVQKETEEGTEEESGNVADSSIDTGDDNYLLNYLYIESAYLETPDIQKILISIGDERNAITSAVLTYTDGENKFNVEADEIAEDTLLFSIDFQEDAENGIYELLELTYTREDVQDHIILSETGIEARFGVNEELEYDDDESEYDDIDMEVVRLDEDGNEVSENSIEDAIEAASDDVPEAVVPFAAASSAITATAAAKDVVVVLDPGHDDKHKGASNSALGLKEETLVLKIAQYCKAELEQYYGVKVYMTRSSGSCPHPNAADSGACNLARVDYAKSVNADIYVSIHLNSSTSSSASGAEIYYPNTNYNASVSNTGKGVADAILKQLTGLGLTSRGLKIRNSENNTTYPNGSLADYYGVIRNSKERGFPAIIVEHAFLSNTSDANKVLRSEAGLKSLGVADATGIANYYGLSKNAKLTASRIAVSSVDTIGGKFTVTVSGVTPVSQVSTVYFPVWTKSDGSDMVWYEAYNAGSGSYTITVYAANHNYFSGAYQIHAYADDVRGVRHNLGVSTACSLKLSENVTNVGIDTFAVRRGIKFYLKYSMDSGGADKVIAYGRATDQVYVGDWNGDGVDTLAVRRGNTIYIKNSLESGEADKVIVYGRATDELLVGDWNGDGKDTFAVRRGREYHIKNSISSGVADKVIIYGRDTDEVYTGDWNGDGVDTLAVRRGREYHVKNSISSGAADKVIIYGKETDEVYVGDWNGDGMDTFAVRRGREYHVKNSLSSGAADKVIIYGRDTDEVFVGTWILTRVESKVSDYYQIMGTSTTTTAQMVRYYNAQGHTYPASDLKAGGAATIEEYCQIFLEEAAAEGVKAEVAFCQAMKETGWLQFGGDVKVSQYNFCGLGATGGVPGLSFPDVRTGVRAQIQHLKAYASTADLNNTCVDPRFQYVTRGCAPYVEWLGQKENPKGLGWATAVGYGTNIANMIKSLKAA